MKTFTGINRDRTGRWLILSRYDHKDGGYFWGGEGWADGSTAAEALAGYIREHSGWHNKFAVLDWQTAQFFTNEPSIKTDA
jgi:hypothetical protein